MLIGACGSRWQTDCRPVRGYFQADELDVKTGLASWVCTEAQLRSRGPLGYIDGRESSAFRKLWRLSVCRNLLRIEFPLLRRAPEAGEQQLLLEQHFLRQAVVEPDEQLLVQ